MFKKYHLVHGFVPVAGPRPRASQGEDVTRDEETRLRVAAALRGLAHAIVDRELDDVDATRLRALARTLTEETALLAHRPRRHRDVAALADELLRNRADDEPLAHFDECYVSGGANPVGFAVNARLVGDEVVAETEFGRAFGVASGHVHGGAIAAVSDDVLGYAAAMRGEPVFTAELTLRYLAPIPTRTPVQLRSRINGHEGRKVFVEAEICRGDAVLAEATAVFVTVNREVFLQRRDGSTIDNTTDP